MCIQMISCMCLFPDLTLAMQKLYQTFVAQAAQLQSVHENVKVSSLPPALSENDTILSLSWHYLKLCLIMSRAV